MTYSLRYLLERARDNQREINGFWHPARPNRDAPILYRIKAAWLVLTGRADAVIWPEDEP